MKESPERLSEVYDKLINDPNYFEYALLNGGWVALLAIPVFIFFAWWIAQEMKLRKRQR